MEVVSLTKYTRVSPKKARQVAKELRGKPANEALELLRFIPRKSARLLRKTLHSAVANAENNHNLNSDDLIIKEAVVEEGPAFRRFRTRVADPAAAGLPAMCHDCPELPLCAGGCRLEREARLGTARPA